MREHNRKLMLEIFRRAIPEISDNAEIVITRDKSVPTPSGIIELQEYDVPGPEESQYAFTIGRCVIEDYPTAHEWVYVLEKQFEHFGRFTILQHKKTAEWEANDG